MGRPSQPLRIWDLPAHEHAAWVAAGFGRCSYEQFRARLTKVVRRARSYRRPVILLDVSVARVLQELAELGLSPTPLGVDMALRTIHADRCRAAGSGERGSAAAKSARIAARAVGAAGTGLARAPSPASPPAAARPPADPGVVWVFRRSDHPAWQRAGFGESGYLEYLRHQAARCRRALRARQPLCIVRATVKTVLTELNRHEQVVTPENCDRILLRLHWQDQWGTIVPELAG